MSDSPANNHPQVVRSLDEIEDLGRPWWLVPDMPVADAHEAPGGRPTGWVDLGATTDGEPGAVKPPGTSEKVS
jgi:hypothetical protein